MTRAGGGAGRLGAWVCLLALVVGSLVGCDGGNGADTTAADSSASSTVTTSPPATGAEVPGDAPSPEELAGLTITTRDLPGGWSGASDLVPSLSDGGVATDEVRSQLPRLGMCQEAGSDAADALAAVEWQAFAQLARPSGTAAWPIILGQYLFAGDANEVQALIDTIREASIACVGVERVSESGAVEILDRWPIPGVGADRIGIRLVSTDAETDSYFWFAFIGQGPVFMFLSIWETTAIGAATDVTQADIDSILTIASSKMP